MKEEVVGAVLRTFLFIFLMCPLVVSTDFGGCFLTVVESSPGKVVKYPLSMAFVHVSMVGLQEARCRYFMRSVFVRNEYTFDACVVVSVVGFSCCAIGINQSPVGQWRSASSTALLVAGLMTWASSRVNQVW